MPERTDAFFYTCILALYSGISQNFSDGSDSTAHQEHRFCKERSCIRYFTPQFRLVRLMLLHLSDTAHTHSA